MALPLAHDPFARHLAAAAAAFGAGFANAIAGGGTLISFPALLGLGLPAIPANVTSTTALAPGYLGGVLAQRRELATQRAGLPGLLLAAAMGGIVGSVLLIASSESLFRRMVPYLLLGACALLAGQDAIKRRLAHRGAGPGSQRLLLGSIFLASIYGGYFGAGVGIVLLALLGLTGEGRDAPLPTLNAVKQAISLTVNCVAAIFFLSSGRVVLGLAGSMALASLLGGHVGGRVAGRLPPRALRAVVLTVGLGIALKMLLP